MKPLQSLLRMSLYRLYPLCMGGGGRRVRGMSRHVYKYMYVLEVFVLVDNNLLLFFSEKGGERG